MKKIILILSIALFANFIITFPSHAQKTDSFIQSEKIIQNENLKKVLTILDNKYESVEKFEEQGNIFVDGDQIYLKLKKEEEVTDLNFEKNLSNLTKNNQLKIVTSRYSTKDLKRIQEQIHKIIQNYYTESEYMNLEFNTSLDLKEEKVILENKNLTNELIDIIKNRFPDMVIESNNNESIEATKSKESNWTKLGAGLGIKNTANGKCSTAGVAKKNGTYFLLTAGHCFNGEVSSTGGANITQFSSNVGKQHSQAGYANLDAGLVRITVSGRSATNLMKLYNTSSTGEDYEASLYGSTYITQGMTLCKTGITTHKTCGQVTYANTTVKYSDIPYTYNVAYIRTAGFTLPGDSGGAVYLDNGTGTLFLAGIVSGMSYYTDANGNKVSTGGYITKYKDVESNYGISLYTSSTPTSIN